MKNNQISSGQIPHLVRLTADLFRTMREETKAPNMNPMSQRDEHNHMHFVADLLKDLVETAYPIKEEGCYIGMDLAKGNDYTGVIEVTKDKETGCVIVTETTPFNPELAEKALENISKITKLKDEVDVAIKKAIPKSIVEEYQEYKDTMEKAGMGDFVLDYISFLKLKQQFKDLDKQIEKIAKMMKNHKSPKAGEF